MSIKFHFKKSLIVMVVAVASMMSCRPACPISSCRTRKVHLHGGGEYRGMPWYKKQNPRIGEKLAKPSKEMQKQLDGKSGQKKGKN